MDVKEDTVNDIQLTQDPPIKKATSIFKSETIKTDSEKESSKNDDDKESKKNMKRRKTFQEAVKEQGVLRILGYLNINFKEKEQSQLKS